MKLSRVFLPVLMIILLLTACSNQSAASTQTSIPAVTQKAISTDQQLNNTEASSYPGPENNITGNTSYPNPGTTIISTPSATFTTDPQMGHLHGKLLNKDIPVSNISLYLAEVITDSTGKEMVAGLDPRNSPNTVTDDQGSFTFTNVKPGGYALILDIVTNQFLLNYPDKDTPIIVHVEAGKEVNLGDLKFNDLTIP